MDAGIHANIITFVALLVANGCFLLHDIIVYIIRPIIRVQLMFPQGQCSINKCIHLCSWKSSIINNAVEYITATNFTQMESILRSTKFLWPRLL